VRARIDDVRDAVAEAEADVLESLASTAVLGSIMQERGDRLVLVAAGIDDEGRDAEEVSGVRHALGFTCGRLAALTAVHVHRVDQCVFETGAELAHRIASFVREVRAADANPESDGPRKGARPSHRSRYRAG